MKDRDLQVCPNCGLILSGKEFLPNVRVLLQQFALAYDPIAGRFLCPRCDFSGIPIVVKERDYNKIEFKKQKIAPPLARANPRYFRSSLLVILLALILVFFVGLKTPILTIILFILLVAALYIEFRIPKYKN